MDSASTVGTNNYTEYGMTNITEFMNASSNINKISIIVDIYGGFQLLLLLIGIIGNILILAVLHKSKGHLPPVTMVLVKHQSVIDAMVCLTVCGHVIIPKYWVSGIFYMDVFLCHVFHSYVLSFAFIYISIWNLVLMATERMMVVRFPLKYKFLQLKHVRYLLGLIYITSLGFNTVYCSEFQLEQDGQCQWKNDFQTKEFAVLLKMYGYLYFSVTYGIPLLLIIIMFAIVLNSLRRRMNNAELGQSSVISTANSKATKSFIYVTILFIGCYSLDNVYYIIFLMGKRPNVTTPLSLFLMALNSSLNPLIYFAKLDFMRTALFKMLRCKN